MRGMVLQQLRRQIARGLEQIEIAFDVGKAEQGRAKSEEHTSELQSQR